MPWVYGAAGLALVLAFVGLSFGTPTLKTSELAVGAGVMALAGLGFGFVLYMVLPPPAGAESTPRILGLAVLSAAGSELLKSAWVAMRRGRLPMRALLLLGLAAGAGFGAGYAIQAGITFSGVARARSYWMEFVTLIAMQSVWSGIAALFVARGRNSRSSTGARIFAAAGVPIALHALFVFFHRQDLFLGSIVIGLISFALFHALHYWTEQTDQEVVAGETIRV